MVKDSIFCIICISKSLSSELTFADFLLKNSAPKEDGLSAAGLLRLPRFLDESIFTAGSNVDVLLDLVGVHGSRGGNVVLLGVSGTYVL